MNRVSHLWGDPPEFPQPVGSFSDEHAFDLLMQYRMHPEALCCPTCPGETIEVLAFIKPEIDPEGFATQTEPEGEYAAALYCHTCKRAIGVLAGQVMQ